MLEQQFSYSVSDGAKAGTVILTLEGPLTLANMFQLQGELRSMKPDCLIMDMESVPYMDSAGLGVIMNYFVSAQGGGRRLLLTAVNDRIRALLELTKVDSVLQTCASVAEAQELA